jgi:hypothetical protein
VIAPIQRAGIAALVVVAMVGFVPLAAQAGPAKGPPNPLADPSTNTQPSQRFVNACSAMRTSTAANKRCDKAALKDFDKVRKKEGLGPMTLPHDFASLSVPSQLLAISDIERVDRGRRAVKGRSKALDRLAQQGANHDEDPPFPNPFTGNSGGANWADAGNSALLDDFYWMYDDGLGSFNGDCTQSNQSGCWGHRHDILNAYDARVVMGAAVAYNTQWGTSMTEEFIGGDSNDKVNVAPSWHTIAATFPVRLAISASRIKVAAGHAVTLTGRVTSHVGHHAVAGQRVQLQQRRSVTGAWAAVVRRRSGPHGVVRFVVRPGHAESYRLVGLTKGGASDGHSAAVRIAIA